MKSLKESVSKNNSISESSAEIVKYLRRLVSTEMKLSFKNNSSEAERFFGKHVLLGSDNDYFGEESKDFDVLKLRDGFYSVTPVIYNGDGDNRGTTEVYSDFDLTISGNEVSLYGYGLSIPIMNRRQFADAIELYAAAPFKTKKAKGPGFTYDKEFYLGFFIGKDSL